MGVVSCTTISHWSHAKNIIPELGQFQAFDASNSNPVDDLPSLKKEARDAVLGRLQRGVPVLALPPMSLEQKTGQAAGEPRVLLGVDCGLQ